MAAAGVLAAGGWGAAPALQAQPLLRCELEASNDVIRLDVRPVTDPYTVPAVPVGRSFRFKAVLWADGDGPAAAQLYTYVYTPRQYVLVHQATYPAPVPGGTAAPLGVQRVYSHRTGSELRYTCEWEVQP